MFKRMSRPWAAHEAHGRPISLTNYTEEWKSLCDVSTLNPSTTRSWLAKHPYSLPDRLYHDTRPLKGKPLTLFIPFWECIAIHCLVMSQSSDLYSSSIYESDAIDNSLAFNLMINHYILQIYLVVNKQSPRPGTLVSFGHFPFHTPSSVSVQIARNLGFFTPIWVKTILLPGGLRLSFGGMGAEKKKIYWDGAKHHSDIWAHFDQVAHYTSGEPKVMCRKCGKILHHPNYTSNGTNSLRRHWKSDGWPKATNKAVKQPSIQKLMQDAVSLS